MQNGIQKTKNNSPSIICNRSYSINISKTTHNLVDYTLSYTTYLDLKELTILICNFFNANPDFIPCVKPEYKKETVLILYKQICEQFPLYNPYIIINQEADFPLNKELMFGYKYSSEPTYIEMDSINKIKNKHLKSICLNICGLLFNKGINRLYFDNDHFEYIIDFIPDMINDAEGEDKLALKSALKQYHKFNEKANKFQTYYKGIDQLSYDLCRFDKIKNAVDLLELFDKIDNINDNFNAYCPQFYSDDVYPILPNQYIGFVDSVNSDIFHHYEQFINDIERESGAQELFHYVGFTNENKSIPEFPFLLNKMIEYLNTLIKYDRD
jgi:hypothetical protein